VRRRRSTRFIFVAAAQKISRYLAGRVILRGVPPLSLVTFITGEDVRKRCGMFPTMAESVAVVSIILLLMLFLPSRYTRPIVVALLVVLLILLAVPFLPQFF
jgi:hypothetical protein